MLYCLINGHPESRLTILDRGLAYGDGLFETMRLVGAGIPLWSRHRARLQRGAERLQIPLPLADIDTWLQQMLNSTEARELDRGVIKLQVTRGAGGRGYAVTDALEPNIALQLHPAVDLYREPAALARCVHPLPDNPRLAGIKHLNRLDNVLASLDCQRVGADDGVLLDVRGNLIETTSCNLFFETSAGLLTPSLAHCGVAGVMRELILEQLAPALGIEVEVGELSWSELPRVEAAFCCNSVRGLRPISHIDGRPLGDSRWLPSLGERLVECGFGPAP